MIISEKINKLAMKAAKFHCETIENECKKVCEKFNCDPKDLIIEYHDRSIIKIKILGSEYSIKSVYTIEAMDIK
jgi:hypothetical protein